MGNFEIIRNKKLDKFHFDCVKKGILKNEMVFGRKPKKIKVFICDTEEEFKKHSRYYYFLFGAGTCLRNGDVVVRSNDFLDRVDKYYENLIVHEINHSFLGNFYKISKPIWLHEGLAIVLEGRLHYGIENDFFDLKKTKELINENNLDFSCIKYRYLEKDFDSKETIRLFYSIWGHFAEFISNKNAKKLVEFLNNYSKNPINGNYDELFVKYFGDSIKDKFEEFVKWEK